MVRTVDAAPLARFALPKTMSLLRIILIVVAMIAMRIIMIIDPTIAAIIFFFLAAFLSSCCFSSSGSWNDPFDLRYSSHPLNRSTRLLILETCSWISGVEISDPEVEDVRVDWVLPSPLSVKDLLDLQMPRSTACSRSISFRISNTCSLAAATSVGGTIESRTGRVAAKISCRCNGAGLPFSADRWGG